MDKQKQVKNMSFTVIDNKTGREADIGKIALKEDWAKGLMYCDMQGFALLEDGDLVLMDECGKYEYCPSGRFTVIPEGAVVLTDDEYKKLFIDDFGIMTSSIGDLRINPEGMRKAVDEIDRLLRVQMELQVINAKYYNENKDLHRNITKLRRETYCKEEVDYKIEQTRKETAEKFAEMSKEKFAYDIERCKVVDEVYKKITEGK